MKKCKECSVEKQKSDFYGVQGECKECTKLRVRKNSKRVGNGYDRTEHGVIRVIYKTQRSNSKKRSHPAPDYTKQQLSNWLYGNGFLALYEAWVASGWVKDLKPSVDRVNDDRPYSLKNIRLVTWLDNRTHQYMDILGGVGVSGKRCKTIYQFDGLKRLIATYVSYSQAARTMGYSLEYQIKKRTKCRGGYLWSYSPVLNPAL